MPAWWPASSVGGARILFAGDLEAAGETSVLAGGESLRAEVLQLPHHGSRTSSTPAFLAAVRPVIALAATGTHPRFAYPDPSVVQRVRALPAVTVGQGDGVASVGWGDTGPLAVGGAEAGVGLHGRGARP